MATKTEETILEKVERELLALQEKKIDSETKLKIRLSEAKSDYENLIKEINTEFNVTELDEEIKRHSYFLKVLKGEIPIPDDLNAKKGKAAGKKSTGRVSDWNSKIAAALEKIGKSANDVKPKELKTVLDELYPELNYKIGTLNSAWNTYKKGTN